jgi:hypothetical protein
MKPTPRKQQQEELRLALQAVAMEQARQDRGERVREAGPELAALQLYELLREFDLAALRKPLKGDVDKFVKLVKLVIEVSGNSLKYEKYRAEVVARKAALLKTLEQARQNAGLSAEALDEFIQQLQLF